MNEVIMAVLGNLTTSIGANVIYDISKKLVKLLPHQESNLTTWLNTWKPSDKDLEIIKNDRNIQRIISILFEKVQNEIFEEKLSTWGKISDSVIRNKKQDYSYELYYIKLFSDMPLSVISYLFEIYNIGEAEMIGQYPKEDSELQDKYFCENYCVCLSLIECFSGKHRLTDFGKQFIDFIGDYYQKNSSK